MSETVASTLEATRTTFPEGMREAEVCTYIFTLIDRLHGGFECTSLAELASQLKWQNDREALKSIQKVLHFLTYGENSIFVEKFTLWAEQDSEDVLEIEEWVFSYEEISHAIECNELIHPINGEPIADFRKKIKIIYCINDFAKKIATINKKGVK